VSDVAFCSVAVQLDSSCSADSADPGAQEWLEGSKKEMTWLAPEDVAETVNFLASQPAHVNLQQVTIMPTRQPS
jgi:NADP-dependent 3-hydroxy acid dehydrogenase YdfG